MTSELSCESSRPWWMRACCWRVGGGSVGVVRAARGGSSSTCASTSTAPNLWGPAVLIRIRLAPWTSTSTRRPSTCPRTTAWPSHSTTPSARPPPSGRKKAARARELHRRRLGLPVALRAPVERREAVQGLLRRGEVQHHERTVAPDEGQRPAVHVAADLDGPAVESLAADGGLADDRARTRCTRRPRPRRLPRPAPTPHPRHRNYDHWRPPINAPLRAPARRSDVERT
jgi:hypothetical protein